MKLQHFAHSTIKEENAQAEFLLQKGLLILAIFLSVENGLNFPYFFITHTGDSESTTPNRLRTRPVLAIIGIVTWSLLKIMALVYVATGSMNAQDAERVAESIKAKGCMVSVTDKAASMGRIIVVVAVFDVISVRKVINKQIAIIIATIGRAPNPPYCCQSNRKDR